LSSGQLKYDPLSKSGADNTEVMRAALGDNVGVPSANEKVLTNSVTIEMINEYLFIVFIGL
jgi:hypothetical protein